MIRLVVCVRWRSLAAVGSDHESEETWGRMLRTLVDRATALGGRIVGWRTTGLSVDFALDGLQDAIDFVLDDSFGSSLSWGLAHGELEACLESHRIALCTGAVLDAASALAECARPGEVLVSPELVRAAAGELLTSGPAKKREGRELVPAFVLDVVHPLRSLLVEAVARLVEPPYRSAGSTEPSPLPDRGKVLVVRGEPGGGGTRRLEEWANGQLDVLWVRPGRTGWPWSALEQALGGEPTTSVSVLRDRLVARAARWVFVDDGEQVDPDSWDVLAQCCAEGAFGLVVRLDQGEPNQTANAGELDSLPALLASFDEVRVERLEPLSSADAAEIAVAATGGRLSGVPLDSLREAGIQLPLQVMERLTEALDSGDWVWSDTNIHVRSEHLLPATSAEAALAARLARLPRRSRLVLEAAAVLGGLIEASDVVRVLQGLIASQVATEEGALDEKGPLTEDEVASRLAQLVANRWLRAHPLRLASATAHRVILREAPPERLRGLHAGAARLGMRSQTCGGRVAAVVHGVIVGRMAQARDLARSTEERMRAIGGSATADGLLQLADQGDTEALSQRGYLSSVRRLSGGHSNEPAIDWDPQHSRSPTPPSVVAAPPPAAVAAAPSPVVAASPREESFSRDEPPSAVSRPPPLGLESDSIFPQQVADAIARRDPTVLLQMAAQMRERQLEASAERLDALASLVQGQKGAALGRLRQAQVRARQASLSEQCRAHLALAIGLGASGRAQEALLEALQGLARAREGGDGRGERACARFVGQLARGFGDENEAAQWESLVSDAET